MIKILLKIIMLGLLLPEPAAASSILRLATTTSTENSGLLAVLMPPFEQANDCRVDIISVGTGRAIKLGERGDVDVILVHARSREDKFINQGYGVDRRNVMYNDFVLIGPPADPAGLLRVHDVVSAMQQIAVSQSAFVSRSDESGTHIRERQLWREAEIEPAGEWYLEAGRGMGEVITTADQRQAYTLSDRGTYLSFKGKVDLQVVFSGEPRLYNPYSAIMVNPQKHPHVNRVLAQKFLDYLVSDRARNLIRNFRKTGEQLFYIDGVN